MYRHIAVPLDGTRESHTALHWALTVARLADCSIDLVTVAYPPAYGTELYGAAVTDATDVDRMMLDAGQRLRRIADEMAALGIRVTSTVLKGAVPSTLADHLHNSGCDLVVFTAHDRGRLEYLLLGSVSHSVVRHVHLPVLLVRAGADALPLTTTAAIRHVLVPLDGSTFGAMIVPHAAALAELMGADLTLLGVVEPTLATAALTPGLGSLPDVPAAPPAAAFDAEHDDTQSRLHSEVLEQTAGPLRARRLTVRVDVIVDARPAHAILAYAKQHDVDLIAMTTHGRGALKRLVAGSVSQKVLRSSPTAMLLYRPELG